MQARDAINKQIWTSLYVAFVGYHARHSLHFVRLAAIIIVVSAWIDENLRTPRAEGSKINCALILLVGATQLTEK